MVCRHSTFSIFNHQYSVPYRWGKKGKQWVVRGTVTFSFIWTALSNFSIFISFLALSFLSEFLGKFSWNCTVYCHHVYMILYQQPINQNSFYILDSFRKCKDRSCFFWSSFTKCSGGMRVYGRGTSPVYPPENTAKTISPKLPHYYCN